MADTVARQSDSITVSFGGTAEASPLGRHQAQKKEILTALTTKLMAGGMPGAFSIPLPAEVGSGSLDCKAIISRKDGRVMYNVTVSRGSYIGKEAKVALTGSGNLLLPKQGFTVDARTLSVYQTAQQGIDAERIKSRASKSGLDLSVETDSE